LLKSKAMLNDFSANVRLPFVRQIIFTDCADSTQNLVKDLARSGAPEGLLVVAARQSGGRGQFDRKWSSPAGGLYMSLLLRPDAPAASFALLSLAVARAAANAVTALYGLKAKIKKPNDVFVLHPKRGEYLKVSGILIETATGFDRFAVVGMGVNMNNALPENLPQAGSLGDMTGRTLSQAEFAETFFEFFSDEYAQWKIQASAMR